MGERGRTTAELAIANCGLRPREDGFQTEEAAERAVRSRGGERERQENGGKVKAECNEFEKSGALRLHT